MANTKVDTSEIGDYLNFMEDFHGKEFFEANYNRIVNAFFGVDSDEDFENRNK